MKPEFYNYLLALAIGIAIGYFGPMINELQLFIRPTFGQGLALAAGVVSVIYLARKGKGGKA